MSTTGTFHPFPRLPWELRAMIWKFAVVSREVDVRVVTRRIQGKLRIQLLSGTPPPAIVQVCKESRDLGVYQKAFAEIPVNTFDFQRKYVWINWEYDTIRVMMTNLGHFRYESIQNSIQRLSIDRDRLYSGEIDDLQGFKNLKQLYISTHDSWNFRWVFRENPLSCGQKNILIDDAEDYITLNSFEWDKQFDERLEYSTAAGMVLVGDDFVGVDLW
ncbi:hypothetical protein B0T20DRAFT_411893 [Sordaria brevicollis]|uniref:2EXR domain-containing protein n=1 Tax=Sordaria brevicollis TaxID=83679 RepID=A0AAE0PF69_SORBR|nr:hypothetical protein B0T20DRAFT_411893 [Sordaria brevicollis]